MRAGGWTLYGLAGLSVLLMLVVAVFGAAGMTDWREQLPMLLAMMLYMAVGGVLLCIAGAVVHALRDIAINSWKQ